MMGPTNWVETFSALAISRIVAASRSQAFVATTKPLPELAGCGEPKHALEISARPHAYNLKGKKHNFIEENQGCQNLTCWSDILLR